MSSYKLKCAHQGSSRGRFLRLFRSVEDLAWAAVTFRHLRDEDGKKKPHIHQRSALNRRLFLFFSPRLLLRVSFEYVCPSGPALEINPSS